MIQTNRLLGLIILLLAGNLISGQENPIELGKVKWLRSYDLAMEESEKSEKPIFLFFQEVPGCSNCTRYGTEILSHPLIVEFIETAFVPLAIHNNKGGPDKKVLERFGESAWNNPVVRLINETDGDMATRISNFRSPYLLLTSMIKVVQETNREIPNYVRSLERELRANEEGSEEAYLSMYCFWTGEKEIARIDGVLSTEAGYMHGKEVVKVTWDKNVTNLERIAKGASRVKCADKVFAHVKEKVVDRKPGEYRKDGEDKYYLVHFHYQFVPMMELQKSLVNSALGKGEDPNQYLSPRQLELLKNPNSKKSLTNESIYESWYL
ncbi:MAG: hypothetical protein ACI9FN_003393 [Saprospiraceae bacterium]|jgi:hypothetical protein